MVMVYTVGDVVAGVIILLTLSLLAVGWAVETLLAKWREFKRARKDDQ